MPPRDRGTRAGAGYTLAAAMLIGPGALAQDASEQRDAYGQRTFEDRCAVCHGMEGRGDGSMAGLLTPRPADLTGLSTRNRGVYPFERVYKIIDGRFEGAVQGHGTRDMPIWGDAFKVEVLEAQIPVYAEEVVQGRILGLVYYLQTLQAP